MTEAADGRGPSGGATVTDDATMRRAVGAAAVGNITEWFDFGVYGYLSTTIEAQFFPPGNPALAQLATFATFAVAFLVRPLGGLFFGPLGDKIGRTKVLAVTVILMATGTFLIGLIPSYSSIGLAAPILLVCARVLQGFSTGGEYAGAMTFIAEYSPDRRRGYFGSFLEFGTFIGYALGATVSSVLPLVSTPAFMDTWGWRIPFMVALPLGIVGVYLRTKLEETPAFQQLLDESGKREDAEAKHVVRTIFAKYWPTMLLAERARGDLERHQLHAHQLHADLSEGRPHDVRERRAGDLGDRGGMAADRRAVAGCAAHPASRAAQRQDRPQADPVGRRRMG